VLVVLAEYAVTTYMYFGAKTLWTIGRASETPGYERGQNASSIIYLAAAFY